MLKENWLDLLGDKHNLEILSLLIDGKPRNLYTISRQSKIYAKTARIHLLNLVKSGIVEEESVGGIRLFKIRREHLPEEVIAVLRWLTTEMI